MNDILQKIMNESFTDEQGERFDHERFAELIVKECAAIAERPHEYIKTQYGKQILKHFGFEE